MTSAEQRLVTVGIAVYNIREDFLRKCIESVIANTGEDTEIIIADDCSREETADICREYAGGENRIVYMRNEENLGIGAVRNKIAETAAGKWLLFVDGDDMLTGRVSDCVSEAAADEYDYIIFAKNPSRTSLTRIAPDGRYELLASALTRREPQADKLCGFMLHPGTVTSVLYRTEFLRKHGCLFKTELKTAEDSLFNATVCLAEPRVAAFPRTVYYYRKNPQSVTHRYDASAKQCTDCYLRVIKDFIEKNNLDLNGDYKKYRCISALIDNFKRDIFHGDNPHSLRERRKSFEGLLASEPYKSALEQAAAADYKNHELRLTVLLAKKHLFAALCLCYRSKSIFRLYGGISNRINIIKGMLERD